MKSLKGCFLVASPQLRDPNFVHTVVLLVHHSEDGAFGVVLNRPTGLNGRSAVAEIETALADSGTFTYRDYSAGTTLVWLSYPADTEVAENDEMGTVE